jgi:hypothetical protein
MKLIGLDWIGLDWIEMDRLEVQQQTVLMAGGQTVQTQLALSATNGEDLGFIQIDSTDRAVVRVSAGDTELVQQVGTQDVTSAVVDISLYGPNGDQVKFTGTATICLRLNETTGNEKQCLAYIDTSVSPPAWKCQDKCLKQVSASFWCGETDHFTNFAVLLTGGSGKDGNGCGDDGEDYFAGTAIADAMISLGVGILIVGIITVMSCVVHHGSKKSRRMFRPNRRRSAIEVPTSSLH